MWLDASGARLTQNLVSGLHHPASNIACSAWEIKCVLQRYDKTLGGRCCRFASAACYNATNAEILLESIVELQTLLLGNSCLVEKTALLQTFQSIIQTTLDFFASFSRRSAVPASSFEEVPAQIQHQGLNQGKVLQGNQKLHSSLSHIS